MTKLLIEDAAVVTMDPALGEFERASILIEDGTIVAVGPGLEADAERTDASEMIAMPGIMPRLVAIPRASISATRTSSSRYSFRRWISFSRNASSTAVSLSEDTCPGVSVAMSTSIPAYRTGVYTLSSTIKPSERTIRAPAEPTGQCATWDDDRGAPSGGDRLG
ncbi:hypothetical protein [Amycolatopsis pigmentata]|uniref:Amidohydrolase family protein n=1 Tax=Amycolatopsis pigmentata TaxID=450801 RepID=A0ABW5FJB9_9PSEU